MKKIVVGLEETEGSRDALVLAKMLGEIEGAELHVVVVLSYETFEADPDEYEAMREKHFEKVFEMANESIGDEYVAHRVDGISAPAGLITAAEELEADAIVLGSSHLGPIGRVLLGDVGARVASGAPCPVVVAPRGFARREHDGLSRVGVGYDGTPESETALARAADFARRLGASLTLYGVVPRLLTPGRISGTDAGYERLLREEMEKRLSAAAKVDGVETDCVIRIGDTADELADASSALDLLVIGSRGYGPLRRVLLGGVAVKLMRSAACPVLILPRSSEKGPARREVIATLAPFTA